MLSVTCNRPCHGWHRTLTFARQLSYDDTREFVSTRSPRTTRRIPEHDNTFNASDMRFFRWYKTYAIYGAREKLILLQPNLDRASVSRLLRTVQRTPLTTCLGRRLRPSLAYRFSHHGRMSSGVDGEGKSQANLRSLIPSCSRASGEMLQRRGARAHPTEQYTDGRVLDLCPSADDPFV